MTGSHTVFNRSDFTEHQRDALQQILDDSRRDPLDGWRRATRLLRQYGAAPPTFRAVWESCFEHWDANAQGPPPMWSAEPEERAESNVARWASDLGIDVEQFHDWTRTERAAFWDQAVDRLGIRFGRPAETVLDLSDGVAHAHWFPGARLNIVNSCFLANPNQAAIVAQRPGGRLESMTFGELRTLVNRVSNSLVDAGFQPGDAIAVVMPMTRLSVAIYLGAIQTGMSIVSIADSFAPPEIATRLRIANACAVITYDHQVRVGKQLPLFERVAEATDLPAIVIGFSTTEPDLSVRLRPQDQSWTEFLSDSPTFDPVDADPDDTINVLFSSGTTGDPKAIPWTQLTPLKCAVDGHCHQDIQPGHICVWPTNLGWMMGPWLIFASLINRATIGLYEDAPMGAGFGEFIQQAQVNMLGVVPTIVKAWRSTGDMERFDWSQIRVFSSTGESSQRDDMFYLSSLAGMRPVIEYCGGTEIGGGYVTSLVTRPNVPAAFNTPAVGLDFVLLDASGNPSDEGEVFIVPPSIGLSQRLLNRDHDATYYEGTPEVEGLPVLRRHGDYFGRLPAWRDGQSNWVAGGRVDDTMNLGGIKVSSAEIERVLNRIPSIRETAAIAVASDQGPSELVVFVVFEDPTAPPDLEALQKVMNGQLKSELNPLFRVARIEPTAALPRTASGKVMRRELRARRA